MAASFAGSPARAESVVPTLAADGSVSAEQVESAIAAIETRDGLDEETRAKVIDQLRDAQAQLQNATSARQSADTFAAAIRSEERRVG